MVLGPKRTTTFYGAALCWIAVLIYAGSNSIVMVLSDIGEQNPVHGHNVVTFSNLFVLGSLISLLPMIAVFWRDWTIPNLQALTKRDWAFLTLASVLSSAITPALFFLALENTTVANVTIVSRIDPPLFMLLAAFLLKEKLNHLSFLGAVIIFAGAILMLVLNRDGPKFLLGPGEVAAALATLSFTLSTILTRATLKAIPLGLFSIFRTVVGTSVFVLFNLLFSGHHEFHAMFQPVVLEWVWLYAVIVVIFGQFAWIWGLKWAQSDDIALAASFSPLAAILIAMLLLGEDPGPGLIPGATIMLLGIVVAQFARFKEKFDLTFGLMIARKTGE